MDITRTYYFFIPSLISRVGANSVNSFGYARLFVKSVNFVSTNFLHTFGQGYFILELDERLTITIIISRWVGKQSNRSALRLFFVKSVNFVSTNFLLFWARVLYFLFSFCLGKGSSLRN